MSKALQWVLGILALVVIVGIIVGAVFMWRNHMTWWGTGLVNTGAPVAPGSQDAPGAPYGFGRYPGYHMGTWGRGMPMHGYGPAYGFMPHAGGFFLLGGLFRLIVHLGILALVAYLFYQMGRRAGQASRHPALIPENKPLPGRKVAGR